MTYEPRLLLKALDEISDKSDLYILPLQKELQGGEDAKTRFYFFISAEGSEFEEIIEGLSKDQIIDFLINLPQLMKVFDEEKIKYLLKRRYRRYVFRMIYVLWQDNFEANDFRNLMLFILSLPKTPLYLEEVGFSADELKDVVLSDNMLTKFVELSLDMGISVREFLGIRRISLTSYLAIDAMCVFFLFCSGEDCLIFGSTKLIWALERFDLRNQAKVINNLYSKLPGEKRREMPDLIKYIVRKHGMPNLHHHQDDFWSLVHSPVMQGIIDDYRLLAS